MNNDYSIQTRSCLLDSVYELDGLFLPLVKKVMTIIMGHFREQFKQIFHCAITAACVVGFKSCGVAESAGGPFIRQDGDRFAEFLCLLHPMMCVLILILRFI